MAHAISKRKLRVSSNHPPLLRQKNGRFTIMKSVATCPSIPAWTGFSPLRPLMRKPNGMTSIGSFTANIAIIWAITSAQITSIPSRINMPDLLITWSIGAGTSSKVSVTYSKCLSAYSIISTLNLMPATWKSTMFSPSLFPETLMFSGMANMAQCTCSRQALVACRVFLFLQSVSQTRNTHRLVVQHSPHMSFNHGLPQAFTPHPGQVYLSLEGVLGLGTSTSPPLSLPPSSTDSL